MEQVKLFHEKLNADETLQGKMKELAAVNAKANVDGIIALAKENGFDFSKEDMEAYNMSLTPNGELSDEQLEQVAGGGEPSDDVMTSATTGFGAKCAIGPTAPPDYTHIN